MPKTSQKLLCFKEELDRMDLAKRILAFFAFIFIKDSFLECPFEGVVVRPIYKFLNLMSMDNSSMKVSFFCLMVFFTEITYCEIVNILQPVGKEKKFT